MKSTGYNRFGDDDGDGTSIVVLEEEDLETPYREMMELVKKSRGYRYDVCLLPIKYKDTFRDIKLIQFMMGSFMIGADIKTQFLFYNPPSLTSSEDFYKK